MKIIQLQRLNPATYENEGGIYVNIDHISVLIPVRRNGNFHCDVLLNNGIVYHTPYNITDILEDIRQWGT